MDLDFGDCLGRKIILSYNRKKYSKSFTNRSCVVVVYKHPRGLNTV